MAMQSVMLLGGEVRVHPQKKSPGFLQHVVHASAGL